MQYRLYRPGDFARLYAIEESCFESPLRFSRAYLRELIGRQTCTTWIAEEDAVAAGFAIVENTIRPQAAFAYIQTIEVDPMFRKRGAGGQLMQRVEESAREAGARVLWLHVDTRNETAIHLYRAHGFERQGRREHYYARGRAADIYIKMLEGDR